MTLDDEPTSLTAQGEGATAQTALQALLDQLPLRNGDAAGGAERATVIRAAAATVEALIPQLFGAMQAAEDDLDLAATAVTLGGLMRTDEGWRAWGTLTGQEMTCTMSPAPRWTPGTATIDRESGRVTIRLTLRREQGDD